MAFELIDGARTWEMTRDKDAHRTYIIKHLVRAVLEDGFVVGGPASALTTPGLPQYGDSWDFDDDVDVWAFCLWDAKVTPHEAKEGEPVTHFLVEQTFSTKPDFKNCREIQIQDPLLEPAKVSGAFVKYLVEATRDRLGRPVNNSAWEQVRGPQIEFDENRPQIKIEMNIPSFSLIVLAYSMIDKLNSSTLWGFNRRCIKLSNAPWERKYKGICEVYYTLTLEFDIRPDGAFDRNLLDEGTKVLNGHWDKATGRWVLDNIAGQAPSRFNPNHFKRFEDRQGNPVRGLLNGRGIPADVVSGLGGLFVSTNTANVGNALTDRTKWSVLPVDGQGDPAEPIQWEANQNYELGDLVKDNINFEGVELLNGVVNYYVCTVDSAEETNPAQDPASWRFVVEKGPVNAGFTNSGNYAEGTVYSKGQYVRDMENTTAGNIRVEKYLEANFLLLGIPLFF